MDQVKAEVAKWNPEETERVTGVPGSQMERVARTLANNRPFAICWCMGSTQHHIGSSNTRAYCILGLAMGMIGVSGGRSEEHTSELQSLMRISYAVFCLQKNKHQQQ